MKPLRSQADAIVRAELRKTQENRIRIPCYQQEIFFTSYLHAIAVLQSALRRFLSATVVRQFQAFTLINTRRNQFDRVWGTKGNLVFPIQNHHDVSSR